MSQEEFAAFMAQEFTHRTDRADPIGAHTVNWYTLPDTAAPAEWDLLRDWVEWITVRYNIPVSVIPDCWWRHGPLVEELSALHTAHTAAFDISDAGYGPIGWHERFQPALARLTRAYGGTCTAGHRDPKPRTWAGVTDPDVWTAWTSQAHAHRDTDQVSPNGRNTG